MIHTKRNIFFLGFISLSAAFLPAIPKEDLLKPIDFVNFKKLSYLIDAKSFQENATNAIFELSQLIATAQNKYIQEVNSLITIFKIYVQTETKPAFDDVAELSGKALQNIETLKEIGINKSLDVLTCTSSLEMNLVFAEKNVRKLISRCTWEQSVYVEVYVSFARKKIQNMVTLDITMKSKLFRCKNETDPEKCYEQLIESVDSLKPSVTQQLDDIYKEVRNLINNTYNPEVLKCIDNNKESIIHEINDLEGRITNCLNQLIN